MDKENILFWGCGFYHYDDYIKKELDRHYNVYYSETSYFLQHYRPIASRLRCLPGGAIFVDSVNRKKMLKVLDETKGKKISKLLLIYGPGASISESLFDKVLEQNPSCDFILYLWDDWARVEKKELLNRYFKKIYSFDTSDCENYGFKHRPLFYIDNKIIETDKEIDIFGLGSDHSKRVELALSIKIFCLSHNLCYYMKYVCGIRRYLLRKYFSGENYSDKMDLLMPYKIGYDTYLDLLSKTRAILDSPYESQCGLTIRTIEALAKGVKVITTNKNIEKHLDIPKFMYYVLDGKLNEDELLCFLKNKQTAILPNRYSLSGFIFEIMGIN